MARYGGDEFTILLECEDRAPVIEIAEQILASAETHDFSAAGHGERVAITFSMGLAIVRERDTVETLFRRADTALYDAKSAGRNCLRVESEEEEVRRDGADVVAGGPQRWGQFAIVPERARTD